MPSGGRINSISLVAPTKFIDYALIKPEDDTLRIH